MTHNICFILLAVDKENNNDPLKIWGLYLSVLAFPGECVNQLGSEVKSIPKRSAGWFKTLDVWHRLMCDIKKIFFIDMKFGINQAISQTITQLSCIQLETPSSRLWNFWWIKTYTTFKSITSNVPADGLGLLGAGTSAVMRNFRSSIIQTIMSLLEASYVIEAPPKGSTNCHKIIAPTQNRAPVNVLMPGTSNTNLI